MVPESSEWLIVRTQSYSVFAFGLTTGPPLEVMPVTPLSAYKAAHADPKGTQNLVLHIP